MGDAEALVASVGAMEKLADNKAVQDNGCVTIANTVNQRREWLWSDRIASS